MTSESFNGNGPSKPTWGQAIRWTKNFRNTFGKNGQGIRGYSLSADTIKSLLSQGGRELPGIKIYFGYDEEKNFRAIVVAVKNDNGDDYDIPAKPEEMEKMTETAALPEIGDTRPCPIYCGTSNVLNEGE